MASAALGGTRIDEAVLIEQARSGDMSAFSRLVGRYQDRILNTCWRICGNLEDARDFTQETLLHAMTRLRSFQHRSQFYTWLFRIAVNLALSHRRKAANRPRLALHSGDGDCLGDQPGSRLPGRVAHEPDDPASRVSARELQQRVLQELDRLDEQHRAIVVLRDIEGFDYHQIGQILELPPGTVKSRLHRARMELRERLAPLLQRNAD